MLAQDNLHGLSNLAEEEQAMLSRFGRGPSIPAPYTTINDAFAAIVEYHPAVIAARFSDQSITYQELDRSANRLANHLIEAGLKPRQRVCLVVQRSFEMLVGILAVLKAGCQYVPMDGGVTSEQAMKHIFTDSNARFVLCLPRYYDKVLSYVREDAVIVTLEPAVGAHCQNTKPRVEVTSKDGAYAIYTSGKSYVYNESDVLMHDQEAQDVRKVWMSRIRMSPMLCC
jgi:non-ribosomal peptide synthetase component F